MTDVRQHLDWLDSQARLTREAKGAGESLTKEEARGIAEMFRDQLPEAERDQIFEAVMAAMAERRNGAKR